MDFKREIVQLKLTDGNSNPIMFIEGDALLTYYSLDNPQDTLL
jgi:hypothetical protein